MSKLVIVESPTKAKTISKFLGRDYKVESSFGHIRDLPKSKLGVDIDNNFEPSYTVPAKSKKQVAKLKELAKKADDIYFATDEDREGEAIAWHLAHILKVPVDQTKRITFHEITEEAIKEALDNPRHINMAVVDSQQARRVLDRLVGYKLSPLLWKKIARGLSAGRVQSVAVRLIVEKEREIQAFKSDEYWEIFGDFKHDTSEPFTAQLRKVDGKTLDKLAIGSEKAATKLVKDIEKQQYQVGEITKRQTTKKPLPPFTTSTLQQEANRRLGFSAKQTMMLAQRLYEGVELDGDSVGLITYMRTDSLNLSAKFLNEAKDFINNKLGDKYYKAQVYKAKSKGAQEAHEAIRPTSALRTPQEIESKLDPRQFKLYQLIWQRAIACQMAPAELENSSLEITDDKQRYIFKMTGQIIKFDGFLKIYPASTKEEILPDLESQDKLDLLKIDPQQKFTQPPARYSDATLVKALEEKGIGRPSTYAPTIATIIARNYVERNDQKRLAPTDIAFVVNDLLVDHFKEIVDYDFTAEMEDDLDKIEEGTRKWQPVIKDFYTPFNKNLMTKDQELNKKDLTEEKTDEKCDKCGAEMVIKMGRFGKFLACSNYPDCKNTINIGDNGEKEPPKKIDEKCPDCGSDLVERHGRYGAFVGCSNYPKCKYIKKEQAQDLNLDCPKCGKGKIATKRSRKGIFYGCDQYPNCDFAFWGKPTGDKCDKCGYPMTETKNGSKCSNRECQ